MLLSADQNAPSAASIVEGFDFAAGGSSPLPGLAAESPQDAEYLIPTRATGAFAEYLSAYPDSPRARLERYIIVQYPGGANLTSARNALLADPAVEHAHVPAAAHFVVPPGIVATRALSASTPAQAAGDWHGTIGVPDIWDIAGGWALVGTVDNVLRSPTRTFRHLSAQLFRAETSCRPSRSMSGALAWRVASRPGTASSRIRTKPSRLPWRSAATAIRTVTAWPRPPLPAMEPTSLAWSPRAETACSSSCNRPARRRRKNRSACRGLSIRPLRCKRRSRIASARHAVAGRLGG